jgi:hypothetical protein
LRAGKMSAKRSRRPAEEPPDRLVDPFSRESWLKSSWTLPCGMTSWRGAVDVEHEARGVGTVADDPQPAPEQQQALVGGEAPGSTITARPPPRGTGSAVARQRASVLRMNFATATPESAPVSEISASHSYSRGDGRVSLKLHPAVVCPPLRKSAEKLTRSPLLTIS